MRILVTGAAGFIGSNTCDLLQERCHSVLALDNFSTGKINNLKNFQERGGNFVDVNIVEKKIVQEVFHSFRPQAVLHLAAQPAITTSLEDPQFDMDVNAYGTLVMIEAAILYGASRFVYASTSAVYCEENSPRSIKEDWRCKPSSPYGISKLAAENYVRVLFKNHAILRYGNVYGPRQLPIGQNQVIARALRHFVEGDPKVKGKVDEFKVVGSGKQKRDFVYVQDIAEANLLALKSDKIGIWNVAYGKSISVNSVLRELEEIYDVPGYRWQHTDQPDPRGDVSMNVSAIRRDLGWRARVNISLGMQKTSTWWEDQVKRYGKIRGFA